MVNLEINTRNCGSGFTEDTVKGVFDIFDTDRNGLVDALELLIAIALVSGLFFYFPYFFRLV